MNREAAKNSNPLDIGCSVIPAEAGIQCSSRTIGNRHSRAPASAGATNLHEDTKEKVSLRRTARRTNARADPGGGYLARSQPLMRSTSVSASMPAADFSFSRAIT